MDSEKTGAGIIGAGVVGLACARRLAQQCIETFLLERHDDFGPDVEWIDSVGYSVDPRRADRFYAEVRMYWPALPDDLLLPAYRGIRPKISGPGGRFSDPGSGVPWHRRTGQPVRHRIPRPHRLPGNRRTFSRLLDG